MWPVLVPGRHYIARRDIEPKLGDIVVAQHPSDPATTIVKRVIRIRTNSIYDLPSTTYELTGTVSWSSTFVVSHNQILGILQL